MTELHTLANGLRVVLDPRPGSSVCAVAITVAAGSRADPVGRSGVAHLVEHLMFRQGSAISGSVHEAGGISNATTHHDHTAYYSLVPSERLPHVLHVEARRFGWVKVTAPTFETEARIVAAEIRETLRGAHHGFPWFAVPQALFDNPAVARLPHGHLAELNAITPADCGRFLDRHYVAANIVLCVVGDFPVGAALATAERTFGRLPAAGTEARLPAAGAPARAPMAVANSRTPGAAPTTTVAIGFPVPDPRAERGRYLEQVVLAHILTAHHLPAQQRRTADLLGARMTVGHKGRWLHRLAPDFALCQLVIRATSAVPEAMVDEVLDHVRREDVTDQQRTRAVNRLALDHYHEQDDPLGSALGLGRCAALGFGAATFTGLGAELTAMSTTSLRHAAAELLRGPRAVVHQPDEVAT